MGKTGNNKEANTTNDSTITVPRRRKRMQIPERYYKMMEKQAEEQELPLQAIYLKWLEVGENHFNSLQTA
jgi:N6-adenosine-specific RNA methylase IME4